MTEEILRLLDELAARINGPAEHVYEVLVRQALVEGWCFAVFFALGCALIAYSIRSVRSVDFSEPSMRAILSILGVVGGFCLAAATATDGEFLPRIINPEYYAIRELLESIR